ncbi:hypothetical protein JCM30760_09960 [Thiomicrorhabdus hydrogeniphila]
MENVKLISLSTIAFNLSGFKHYSKSAVELVSNHHGKTSVDTVYSEKAYLHEDGSLTVQILNSEGNVIDIMRFDSTQFRIETKH